MMENILWNTWQYLVDVFDCFLILYLFRKMMRTRLRQPKYYYLFLPVLAAVLFACNCWLSGMIGLGVMTCVYAAFSLLLFRGTVMMRLFWPAFCSVLFFSIDFIYSSALLMFFPTIDPYTYFSEQSAFFMVNTLATRLLIATAVVLVTRKAFRLTLSWRNWMLSVFIPAVSGVIMLLLKPNFMVPGVNDGLFLLVAVLLFLVNILCLWQTVSISRYTAMAARQEAELKLKGLEDTQYQNLLDTHKTLMGWRHDFFNHLSVIGQMIQTGRGDEALGYIEALRNKTNESSTMVNSGNLAVDSILNAKLPAARENGIRVSLRLEVPKMKTDPVDLCTLLGNLWDNAFEANMYLENHSERFIRLTVRPSDFFCSIHMENPVAPGREEQAESHESTKHLPGHGLGVGQIKKTVQKYDGVYSLRLAQPGRFVVDLLLPIDAAAPVEQVFVWERERGAGMIDRFADWLGGSREGRSPKMSCGIRHPDHTFQSLSYGVVLAVLGLGVLPLSAVFLAVYTVLRKTVGGWHAKTPFSCALSSIAVWGAGLLLAAVAAKSAALLFAAWAAGCLALWCKAPCVMPDEEDTLELRRKLRLRTAVVCAVVLGAALLSMWLYSPALRRGAAAAVASVPVVALTMLAGIHAGRNEKE
ncbi:MAG: accessory gene regulator B family protein [Ruthenibacterium lactatiformans]